MKRVFNIDHYNFVYRIAIIVKNPFYNLIIVVDSQERINEFFLKIAECLFLSAQSIFHAKLSMKLCQLRRFYEYLGRRFCDIGLFDNIMSFYFQYIRIEEKEIEMIHNYFSYFLLFVFSYKFIPFGRVNLVKAFKQPFKFVWTILKSKSTHRDISSMTDLEKEFSRRNLYLGSNILKIDDRIWRIRFNESYLENRSHIARYSYHFQSFRIHRFLGFWKSLWKSCIF